VILLKDDDDVLQYLHYISLGVQPRKTEFGSRLDRDQLPHIINPIEAYLGPSVRQIVTFVFFVFVVSTNCNVLVAVTVLC